MSDPFLTKIIHNKQNINSVYAGGSGKYDIVLTTNSNDEIS